MDLSWDETHGVMTRAVERGLARRKAEPLTHLGVDEKAFRKGHRYMTIVNDLQRSRVLYVAEERKQSSLDAFWPTLSAEQREGIQAVAMDIRKRTLRVWDPYVTSVRAHLSEADRKIVFDKFHIAGHLGEAVDKVRRQETRVLVGEGDNRLVGTKYDWLRNPANFKREDWQEFQGLRQSRLQTARAWALSGMCYDSLHLRLRWSGEALLPVVV